MIQPHEYLYCVKRGTKWFALAGTNSGGCLAGSETVFSAYGFKGGEPLWSSAITKQKNFGGYADGFRIVEMSETDQKRHWFRGHIVMPWYKSWEHFLSTFPDAAEFEAELKPLKG